MKDGNKFLYEGKYILLGLLIIALVCSSLSFFLPINFTRDKTTAYFEIRNGVSNSLYNDTNPDLDGIFTYYLRSNKKDSPSFDDYGEDYYEDYSLINFDEDQVSIRTFDGFIVKLYKASPDRDIFLKETTYDEGNIITKEVPAEEFYYYNPLYKDQEAYKLRYLTNDNIFLRTYGSDFKFDPLTMDFYDTYVYVVGTYDGKTAKILKTNAGVEGKATIALSYLEDAVDEIYKSISSANKIKNLNFAYVLNTFGPAYADFLSKTSFQDGFFPKLVIFLTAATGIFLILSLVTAYDKARASRFYQVLGKFPLELAIIFGSLIFTYGAFYFSTEFLRTGILSLRAEYTLGFLMLTGMTFLIGLSLYYLVFLFKDLFANKGKSYLVKNSLILRFIGFFKRQILTFLRKATGNFEGTKKSNVLLALGLMLLIGFIGANAFTRHPGFVFFLWCILVFSIGYFLKGYYDSILALEDLSKKIKDGDFTSKVDEDKTRFKTLAHNLNTVSQNMDQAIEEALKSERMKTELITNVSHDLKTPLTSIINYSELLIDEDQDMEAKVQYAQVINDKAHKLKVLIENLFDLSKATAKAIDLHMEDLDFVQLVDQVLGEWEDKLEEKNISVNFTSDPGPIILKLDGNQTYRILENLLSNIYKYSLEGTRLYVDLKRGDKTTLTLKNISKYPLNISAEELLERFTRGDASRNTEGSGLGLSIASSLTELQGGTFHIEIDGDLFKTSLVF